MKELPKVYDPKQVESKIYDMWMRGGYFAGKADPDKKPFSIVMPPPNVTGLCLGSAIDHQQHPLGLHNGADAHGVGVGGHILPFCEKALVGIDGGGGSRTSRGGRSRSTKG